MSGLPCLRLGRRPIIRITDPIPSHWDPITEKAVPDKQ